MTAQEKDRIECAIRHIQTAVDIDPWAVEIAVKAMEKEISALQAQDSPKPTAGSVQNVQNEDLISRKAAIDAVEHITSSMSVCVNTDECHGMKRMQRQAVIELANLPSAQPEPCDDAVSREAIESILYELYEVCTNMDELVHCMDDNLKKLPSAQPEIIRCKDCKHHHYEKDIPYCDRIDYGYGWKNNDYCSRAERRTDE